MEYTTIGAIVIAIVAICEGVKKAGLQSRYIPLLSVVLGIAAVLIFDGVSFLNTLAGVIVGLTVTGGYRLVKTTILNK